MRPLLLTGLLLACSGQPLDYAVVPDNSWKSQFRLEPERVVPVQRGIERAALQLGLNVEMTDTPSPEQTKIPLSYSSDCGGDTYAGAQEQDGAIEMCTLGIYSPAIVTAALFMHEFGHVLGADHIPCNGRSIMAAYVLDSNCFDPPPDVAQLVYSAEDLTELCSHAPGLPACKRNAAD